MVRRTSRTTVCEQRHVDHSAPPCDAARIRSGNAARPELPERSRGRADNRPRVLRSSSERRCRARPRRRRRVAAGEPGVVGRRRRRLPRRARRRPRRRRLRLVPRGLARGRARLLGDVARAPRARGRLRRWRPVPAGWRRQGARRSASTSRAACCARRRARAATGVACRSLQADAERLPFADGAFDLACSAFGAVPFVADPAGCCRGRPGAAAGRPVGLRGQPPDALGVPRRPGPGRARRAPVVLRPHALRGDRRGRRRRPTSSTTARWATGSGTVVAAGLAVDLVEPEWPEDRAGSWGSWSPLRGRCCPVQRSSSAVPPLIGLRCGGVDRPHSLLRARHLSDPAPGDGPVHHPRAPARRAAERPAGHRAAGSGRATRSSGRKPVTGTDSPTGCCTAGRARCSRRRWLRARRDPRAARAHARRPGAQLHPPPRRRRRLGDGPARPVHVGRSTSTSEIVLIDDRGRRTCTARLTCLHRDVPAG